MRYWWVNQNKTYKAEVGGGYMWSPKSNKDGGFNQFYKNMTEVGVGDIVFSFSNTLIKTVGVVSSSARSSEKPKEFGKAGDAWDTDGWLVQVDYEEISNPLKPKNHMDILGPLLPDRYSPIRADGGGNQVYLAEISKAMATSLLSLIGHQLDVVIEEGEEREIKNRTDIDVTEKYQLVRSRVGQGQYRNNLERHEAGCRITGITDKRFLTASHIKPWVKSNDFEKLDGNNGLLLSPHIDRLFDRGYISFQDNGQLIFSPSLPSEVMTAWGLNNPAKVKPLTNKQSFYMNFHRSEIFRHG
ncbi:HNH endonuclease [Amylibacter sp.]|nr:HNH endonuclease [Amylibacter sp.]